MNHWDEVSHILAMSIDPSTKTKRELREIVNLTRTVVKAPERNLVRCYQYNNQRLHRRSWANTLEYQLDEVEARRTFKLNQIDIL